MPKGSPSHTPPKGLSRLPRSLHTVPQETTYRPEVRDQPDTRHEYPQRYRVLPHEAYVRRRTERSQTCPGRTPRSGKHISNASPRLLSRLVCKETKRDVKVLHRLPSAECRDRHRPLDPASHSQ